VLLNKNTGKKEEFTILGPWESDPDNYIISYLSPFGGTVLNKVVGDHVDFTNNDEKTSYLIEGISSAFWYRLYRISGEIHEKNNIYPDF